MIAKTQYDISTDDLAVVLALSRGKTLATAGMRLGIDGSTVFRSLKRIEKGLGHRLFERTRDGYLPTDLALRLLQHAETVESELQAARGAMQASREAVSGIVRISAVDAVLNSLVIPALAPLVGAHPHLQFELHASNEITSLTRRDVDIALRSTLKPPSHLIGKRIGSMRFAVFAHERFAKTILKGRTRIQEDKLDDLHWIGVDDAMPEHPGVTWRKRWYPKATLAIQANSMLSVADAIEAGMGVGIMACFHGYRRPKLVPITAPLSGCAIDLWLLTHPESRHLRRISIVAQHLAKYISLDN